MRNSSSAKTELADEAALYAQTYGDVWTDEAKDFLEEVQGRVVASAPAAPEAPAQP